MSLRGHWRTLAPFARRWLRPPRPVPTVAWSTVARDSRVGPVRLTGRLAAGRPAGQLSTGQLSTGHLSTGHLSTGRPGDRGNSELLTILVHGLAGSAGSAYLVRAQGALASAGVASLALNLRGADRSGEDFYHAGLTDDLHAALADPSLAPWPRVAILGFSLGGHVALRFATEEGDPRLVAVAAACAPVDLAVGARFLDRPVAAGYRRYLLDGLREMYGEVARRRPVPTPPERLERVRTIVEWDDLTVAPRYGFDDAWDYYRRASVGPRLPLLRVPALLVASEADPMVPARGVRPWLQGASRLDVRWAPRSGHLGFPRRLDLGLDAPRGFDSQVAAWLLARAG